MSTARPILVSAPMVSALREGRQTQMRRLVKPQPESHLMYPRNLFGDIWQWCTHPKQLADVVPSWRCPFGQPGDLLWVREEHYRFGHWEPVSGMRTKAGRVKWRFVADRDDVLYEPPAQFRKGRHHKDPATRAWHKRLARFMPRRFSRLTLRITDVRVERLQDISDADAIAEGCPAVSLYDLDCDSTPPARHFRSLWESINGPGSWAANPWVWRIAFDVIKRNVDDALKEAA